MWYVIELCERICIGVREAEAGRWVTGIAWEDFRSVQ
jgi:hypothetical protein